MTQQSTQRPTQRPSRPQRPIKTAFSPINTENAVKDIMSRFSYITRNIRNNREGTKLHNWEKDIMYISDEITRGSIGAAPKIVSKAYYLMQQIDAAVRDSNFSNKA